MDGGAKRVITCGWWKKMEEKYICWEKTFDTA